MELFEPDGKLGFSVNAGARTFGTMISGYSFPQKPLRITMRKGYGDGNIEYQVFPDLPITEFERLDLRIGGNEAIHTYTG